MAASLLPPAVTLANKYPTTLLHPFGAKPHASQSSRLIFRCAATGDAAADDGWTSFLDELKKAADPSGTAPVNSAVAMPDDLVTALPPDPSAAGDAANAAAAAGAASELLLPGVVDASGAAASSGDAGAGAIPDGVLSALHLDATSPAARAFGGAVARLESLTAGLSEAQRWALAGFVGVAWLYLTARPGVLSGAVDAYVLAPLQKALDSALGRRSLKMSDFVVGERIGEGSFGVVYFGAVVPRNGPVPEERSGRARTSLQNDERYKEKVILKKIKFGTVGAKECGDYEEWFNYRVSRATPESCADFLGSFVADKTKSEFIKGGRPDAGELPGRPRFPVEPGAAHVRSRAARAGHAGARRAGGEAGDAAAGHVPEAHPRHGHRAPRHQAFQPRGHPARAGEAHRLRRRHRPPHRQELRPRPRPPRPRLLPARALRPPRGDPRAPSGAHSRHPLPHPLAAEPAGPVRHVLGGDSADADGDTDAADAVGAQELQRRAQVRRLRPQQVAGEHAAEARPADPGPRLRPGMGPRHQAHLAEGRQRRGQALRRRRAAAPVFPPGWRSGRGRAVQALAQQIGIHPWLVSGYVYTGSIRIG
ncbi:unnamed protein product [Urochloa decumbens]|uniref:Protein kinase domain-containing protein n=1 Tax=Urochloa decumbens TaxID=240449 RepID=A0ABC8W2Z3_9POAL